MSLKHVLHETIVPKVNKNRAEAAYEEEQLSIWLPQLPLDTTLSLLASQSTHIWLLWAQM